MTTGSVKKVVSDRGFGFITADDGKDYFFHRTELDSSLDFDRLSGGEKVAFDVEPSPRGPRAVRVKSGDGSNEGSGGGDESGSTETGNLGDTEGAA